MQFDSQAILSPQIFQSVVKYLNCSGRINSAIVPLKDIIIGHSSLEINLVSDGWLYMKKAA